MRLDQLGVQVHCLRHRIAEAGLPAVLDWVAGLGLTALELVSFPGCRGNRWGDFGAATELAPERIASALQAAGLHCPSVMVSEAELAPDRLRSTLAWVGALGCRRIVLTALHPVNSSGHGPSFIQRVHDHAQRCRSEGFAFMLHTQPELWAPGVGRRAAETLLMELDLSLLRLEYDPAGAIQFGADPAGYLRRRPDAFYAVHLRDGHRPFEPAAYLPAEPVGRGQVNWPELLRASERSAVEWYFLEMEVVDPNLTQSALQISLSYLRQSGLVGERPYCADPA